MISSFANDDRTERRVWIRLTEAERQAIKRAHRKAWLSFKTAAEIMGPELEAIVCGHRPERYIDLKDWESK